VAKESLGPSHSSHPNMDAFYSMVQHELPSGCLCLQFSPLLSESKLAYYIICVKTRLHLANNCPRFSSFVTPLLYSPQNRVFELLSPIWLGRAPGRSLTIRSREYPIESVAGTIRRKSAHPTAALESNVQGRREGYGWRYAWRWWGVGVGVGEAGDTRNRVRAPLPAISFIYPITRYYGPDRRITIGYL
jgi:hypothetical protein